MRTRWMSRLPGPVCMGLALLICAVDPTVHAAEPPRPGVLTGTVVRAIDGAPVSFAHVADTVSRRGATTDELGRFLIADLPAGRLSIRVQALGGPPLVETIDLAPGDTVRRVYRLASPAHERFLARRDSLAARGLWPPTLDHPLHAHMREALDIRVFRLDPEHPVDDPRPDPARRVGPWPIVGEARSVDRAGVADLVETLRLPALYLPRLQGEIKMCGGFAPGVDVRFVSTGVTVDLLLCYACDEFSILRDGRACQSGDFADQGTEFLRFARRMFPADPVFRNLALRKAGAPR